MATLDELTGGIQIGSFDNESKLAKTLQKHIKADCDEIVFFCIGTDRATGDSLGPLIGTMLKEKGYLNVIGDIDDLVHAMNLDERMKEIGKGKLVIAIDAALGKYQNVGKVSFCKGPLSPGAGIGKELTKVGDYNLQGTVNVSGYREFDVIQSTRLSLVIAMAKKITTAIEIAIPLVTPTEMTVVK